ncbi:MAG: PTS sugar transporter subunit IIA [Eubacteriaceae bacterium]|nr:PTS sugar transporter subunit IIA [Eubacteriaceae bacterium]
MENLINEKLVFTDQGFKTKEAIIEFMAAKMNDLGRLKDYPKYLEAVYERERTFPTCIGFNVAIPHGKSDSVKTPSLGFMSLKEAMIWNCDEEVKLVFLIAVPEEADSNLHLKVLAQLSTKLMDPEFRESLEQLKDAKEICSLLTFDI